MNPPPGTHIRYDLTIARIGPPRGFGVEIYRSASRLVFFLGRWKVAGDFPPHPKAVVLAAPHTSNWDGIWMIAAAGIYRIRLHWMGKASLGRGPLGWLAKAGGLIPIDRSGGKDLVRATVEAFETSEQLLIAIAPEGTRGSVGEWKSGFYHIARLANVPIIFAVMDYGTRTVRISGEIWPSGDYAADLAVIRTHYADARGRHLGKFSLGEAAPKIPPQP
ncbi:1-acyl-sn-glycerol-3-phosphate acyltransferase [Sandaracinobacteroides hominis]|uniref:1-acyl-sn-glycerol-3-phosphate acyltransferase n=1 Tax=Sandaracinobacteroides hominis TaxID=2780086 RepID=UPI0018F79EEC|nr:1-acyl-sn-glycerol-3-phosphate acyltransferase [Sandaracinobacteroides hominis]